MHVLYKCKTMYRGIQGDLRSVRVAVRDIRSRLWVRVNGAQARDKRMGFHGWLVSEPGVMRSARLGMVRGCARGGGGRKVRRRWSEVGRKKERRKKK